MVDGDDNRLTVRGFLAAKEVIIINMVDFRLVLLHLLVQHQIAVPCNQSQRDALLLLLLLGSRRLIEEDPPSRSTLARTEHLIQLARAKEQNHKSLQQQWLIISTLLSPWQGGSHVRSV